MKYMGSKARIIQHIAPIMLKGREWDQWYVEPFVGGGNSICHVDGLRVANDANRFVVALLYAVAKGWVPIEITREQYADIRANQSEYPEYVVGWAGIGCSYSGKWFGGYAGVVQTRGGVRNYQGESRANVRAQAAALSGVNFTTGHYADMTIPNRSIVYCDPPYEGTTKYATDFDHTAFWTWCRQLVTDGHRVFVSEYTAPADWTCVWEKQLTSSLSANGKSGGNKFSTERLFHLPPD